MRYIITIVFTLASLGLQAQADTIFTLIAEWGSSTQLTDSTFSVSAEHPIDQLGQGFLPTQIQVGYYCLDAYGRRYVITAIGSADFGSSTLTVKELQNNNLGPSGVGLVYRKQSDNDRIPVPPGGNTGLAPATLARIHIHNVVNGSTTIDSAEWATLYALQDTANAIRADFPAAGVSITDVRNEIADTLATAKLDSITLVQDSILLGWIRGVEVSRDTIAGTGGGGGSSLWTQNGSDIYYNSGGVVVGATSTDYNFQSSGESRFYNDAGVSAATQHIITKFQRFESGAGNAGFAVFYVANGTAPTETMFFFPGAIDARLTTFNNGDGVASIPSIFIEDNASTAPSGGSQIGINTASPRYTVDIGGDDAIRVPSGSTATRPTGSIYGLLRGNSNNGNLESWNFATGAWDGLEWVSTRNTSTAYIPYWDGNSWENSPISRSGTGQVRIADLTPTPTRLIGADADGDLGQVTTGTGLTLSSGTLSKEVSSGSGAPGTTPGYIGAIYVDTTGGVIYMAAGTSSSADWKQISN